jgi:hypothetical protein
MSQRAEHYGKFLNAASATGAGEFDLRVIKGRGGRVCMLLFALAYSALISTLTTQTQVMPH